MGSKSTFHIYLHKNLFLHAHVEGHLIDLLLWTVINKVARRMSTHIFAWVYIFISVGYMSGVKTTEHSGKGMLNSIIH